jgi:hypothetical protein
VSSAGNHPGKWFGDYLRYGIQNRHMFSSLVEVFV